MPTDLARVKALAKENTLLRDEIRSLRDQLFAQEQELVTKCRSNPANPVQSCLATTDTTEKEVERTKCKQLGRRVEADLEVGGHSNACNWPFPCLISSGSEGNGGGGDSCSSELVRITTESGTRAINELLRTPYEHGRLLRDVPCHHPRIQIISTFPWFWNLKCQTAMLSFASFPTAHHYHPQSNSRRRR